MSNEATATVLLVLPYNATYVEAHVEGCKSASRRVQRVATEVVGRSTVEKIRAMQANPDEGHVKIHACLTAATGLRTNQ